MLAQKTIIQIAQQLYQAEQCGEQIRQVSLDYPMITIEDAYAIQRQWVAMKIQQGQILRGHKKNWPNLESHANQFPN